MYGRISDPVMRTSRPRLALILTSPRQLPISQWHWGFHTVRGGIDPEDHRFHPRFDGGNGRISDSRTGTYPPPGARALQTQAKITINRWGWDLHTAQRDIDSGGTVFVSGLMEL